MKAWLIKAVFDLYQPPPGAWCEKWAQVSSPKGKVEDMQRGPGEKRAVAGGIPQHINAVFCSQKESLRKVDLCPLSFPGL